MAARLRRTRRLRFLVGALCLLLAGNAIEASAGPEAGSCLDRASRKLPKDRRILLELRSGDQMEGTFQGRNGEALLLRVYRAPVSRFIVEDVPGNSIAVIRYRERKVNLAPAVILGLALGGLGLGAAEAIRHDPDWGTSRDDATILLPVLGLAVGFGLGTGIAYLLGRTQETVINCAAPAPSAP